MAILAVHSGSSAAVVVTLLAGPVLGLISAFRILRPQTIQRWTLAYYDHFPFAARHNPFLAFMRSRRYIAILCIAGAMLATVAAVWLWALVDSIVTGNWLRRFGARRNIQAN